MFYLPIHHIHSPVDGHLGYFQFWAIMNNAVMYIHLHVFLGIHLFISIGFLLRKGISESNGKFIFNWSGVPLPSPSLIISIWQIAE